MTFACKACPSPVPDDTLESNAHVETAWDRSACARGILEGQLASFEWRSEYSVGVDILDRDHKLLFALINLLDDAVQEDAGRDVLGSVLTVLVEYIDTHFAREERFMREGNYPHLEAHIVEHDRLARQVQIMSANFRSGELDTVGQSVLEFLKGWLTGHILDSDQAFTPYVTGSDDGEPYEIVSRLETSNNELEFL